jgi:hypothetical protein
MHNDSHQAEVYYDVWHIAVERAAFLRSTNHDGVHGIKKGIRIGYRVCAQKGKDTP